MCKLVSDIKPKNNQKGENCVQIFLKVCIMGQSPSTINGKTPKKLCGNRLLCTFKSKFWSLQANCKYCYTLPGYWSNRCCPNSLLFSAQLATILFLAAVKQRPTVLRTRILLIQQVLRLVRALRKTTNGLVLFLVRRWKGHYHSCAAMVFL